MTSIEIDVVERTEHPLDVVERLAHLSDWSFDRADENEISVTFPGSWGEYHVAFTWLDEMEALHIACAFDLKVPQRKRNDILELVSLINEQLWVGHFDLWSTEEVVMFRHSLLLAGGAEPNGRQCETLIRIASTACDRYYQSFQFVLWAGKSPREALEGAMFETIGQA
jgi:hypothetical protein